MELIFAFPWQHSMVSYCLQLPAGQQQYKGEALLLFRGNIQWFIIVYSYLQVINNTKGKHCSFSVATMVRRTRHNVIRT
jgi:hypothetical protein